MTPDVRVSDRAPTVSVIVPTYQRRELVELAVSSVLAQTYRDFELLVVDDGSTDGTRETLAPLGTKLRYRWQPNRGVAAARNAGLRMARGSIIAFLDSDDRWLPDHLAVVTEVLGRLPETVLVTTSPRYVIGGRAGPDSAHLYDPLPLQFFANQAGYPSCVAVRRDAVAAAGGFNERLLVGEDSELFLRLAMRGPFSMLQRRTVIKGYTRGLREWGRRRGEYLDTMEYRSTRAIQELLRAGGGRAHELIPQAQGALAFVTALRALDRGDDHAVENALRESCRLLPYLSREADIVGERLGYLAGAHEPRERLRHLATAARLWPDPEADAALFLRVSAILLACRLGSLVRAGRLFAGWPLRPTPAFLRRALPAFGRRAWRRMDAHLHPAKDDVDLDSRPVVAARGALMTGSVVEPSSGP